MVGKIIRLLKKLRYPPARKAILHNFRIRRQIRNQFSLTEKTRKQIESINLSLALLPRPNDPRYFAILRPGHCGSVWLAKLLNSHPDVICFHEGVCQRIFPLQHWEIQDNDCIAWLYSMKVNHNRQIYRAIGDIGTITPNIAVFPEIRERFTIFGLTRHGVLYVRSQLAPLNKFASIPKPLNNFLNLGYNEALEHFPALTKLDSRNLKIRVFISYCWNWLEHIETPTIKTYRIEDLNNINLAAKAFKEITGLNDAPMETIKTMINQRINPHVGTKEYDPKKIYFEDWDETQRFIFDTICGEKMKEWYEWTL